MRDLVLVLNAGSSSLKFAVYRGRRTEDLVMEVQGQVDGIGSRPRFSAKDAQGVRLADEALGPELVDGKQALEQLFTWLRGRYDRERLLGVGHRVVHGGAHYARPVRVTQDVLAGLRELIPLAPLHQPFNVHAIDAVLERVPDLPQVACFDTGFHRQHAPVVDLVPLPAELRAKGLQRYGFHGLSYEYIASVLPAVAPELAAGRVVVAHLGSGASVCAISAGRGVDSSLGFTALDGLCMGTRPGALDPGVVLYLFQSLGMSASEVENLLYRKSGLLGISGISNDMRVLLESPAPEAALAVDYFVYRAAREIAGQAATLGGIDGLVFTAGIGENSSEIRRRVGAACAWLGLNIDEAANSNRGPRISTADSRVSAWVIPTNEELMIARHTMEILTTR